MAKSTIEKTEQRIEEFAEDLGRLLGTARAKAEGWIGQRQKIAKQLTDIGNTAAAMYSQLMGQTPAGRRGGARRAKTTGRKRRRMSADARRRISEAQKKRWAAQKGAAKK